VILDAAKNVTYDEEDQLILKLQIKLGEYLTKIQQVRDFHTRGETEKVLVYYREAAQLIDRELLPTAAKLNEVNWKALDTKYSEQKIFAGISLSLILISEFVLVGVLLGTQFFLNNRMRRTLNLGLLSASVLTVLLLGYTAVKFLSASSHLKVAKEDAFESIKQLREARSIAYSANGDESRYLLDRKFADQHQAAFREKVDRLVGIPPGMTIEKVAAALARGETVPGFTGYFANEFNNITFEGEKEAAIEMLQTFGSYLEIDRGIRQLEEKGQHLEAIALCVGQKPNESNWAFERFKEANQKTLDINIAAFDTAIDDGFQDLKGFDTIVPSAAVLISILTLWGLRSRIREYEI
jgi:hypothetical protein